MLVPLPGIELDAWHWKHQILTTGPPGNSFCQVFLIQNNIPLFSPLLIYATDLLKKRELCCGMFKQKNLDGYFFMVWFDSFIIKFPINHLLIFFNIHWFLP